MGGAQGGGARPRADSSALRSTEAMMMRDAEEPVDVVAAKAAALVSQEVCSPLPHPGSVGVHPGAQE